MHWFLRENLQFPDRPGGSMNSHERQREFKGIDKAATRTLIIVERVNCSKRQQICWASSIAKIISRDPCVDGMAIQAMKRGKT
jgi:hypothetical protein